MVIIILGVVIMVMAAYFGIIRYGRELIGLRSNSGIWILVLHLVVYIVWILAINIIFLGYRTEVRYDTIIYTDKKSDIGLVLYNRRYTVYIADTLRPIGMDSIYLKVAVRKSLIGNTGNPDIYMERNLGGIRTGKWIKLEYKLSS